MVWSLIAAADLSPLQSADRGLSVLQFWLPYKTDIVLNVLKSETLLLGEAMGEIIRFLIMF